MLNEENDRMMMIITALAAELSALRERLDTHEALGEQRRFATSKAVETFELTDRRGRAREAARQHMLARVFRILEEDLEGVSAGERSEARRILSKETAD